MVVCLGTTLTVVGGLDHPVKCVPVLKQRILKQCRHIRSVRWADECR